MKQGIESRLPVRLWLAGSFVSSRHSTTRFLSEKWQLPDLRRDSVCTGERVTVVGNELTQLDDSDPNTVSLPFCSPPLQLKVVWNNAGHRSASPSGRRQISLGESTVQRPAWCQRWVLMGTPAERGKNALYVTLRKSGQECPRKGVPYASPCVHVPKM